MNYVDARATAQDNLGFIKRPDWDNSLRWEPHNKLVWVKAVQVRSGKPLDNRYTENTADQSADDWQVVG